MQLEEALEGFLMNFVKNGLTIRDVRDIYSIFESFDQGKMYWSPENVESFMKAYNYECTKMTSYFLFKQMDEKGDGRVEFEDFFEFITSTRPVTNNDGKIKTIFYKFSQGKEYLNEEDMIRICRSNAINITEEQAKEMFYK